MKVKRFLAMLLSLVMFAATMPMAMAETEVSVSSNVTDATGVTNVGIDSVQLIEVDFGVEINEPTEENVTLYIGEEEVADFEITSTSTGFTVDPKYFSTMSATENTLNIYPAEETECSIKIDGVQDKDGNTISETISFTAGVILPVAYKENKIIVNVAEGIVPTPANDEIHITSRGPISVVTDGILYGNDTAWTDMFTARGKEYTYTKDDGSSATDNEPFEKNQVIFSINLGAQYELAGVALSGAEQSAGSNRYYYVGSDNNSGTTSVTDCAELIKIGNVYVGHNKEVYTTNQILSNFSISNNKSQYVHFGICKENQKSITVSELMVWAYVNKENVVPVIEPVGNQTVTNVGTDITEYVKVSFTADEIAMLDDTITLTYTPAAGEAKELTATKIEGENSFRIETKEFSTLKADEDEAQYFVPSGTATLQLNEGYTSKGKYVGSDAVSFGVGQILPVDIPEGYTVENVALGKSVTELGTRGVADDKAEYVTDGRQLNEWKVLREGISKGDAAYYVDLESKYKILGVAVAGVNGGYYDRYPWVAGSNTKDLELMSDSAMTTTFLKHSKIDTAAWNMVHSAFTDESVQSSLVRFIYVGSENNTSVGTRELYVWAIKGDFEAYVSRNSANDGFDIDFTYEMNKDTLNTSTVMVKDADYKNVTYTAELSEDGKTYSVKPDGGLTSSAYTVIVTNEIASEDGRGIQTDMIVPFVTGKDTLDGALLEYDVYINDDNFAGESYFKGTSGSKLLLKTSKDTLNFMGTTASYDAHEGWYHVSAKLSNTGKTSNITVTMPNGGTMTRGVRNYVTAVNGMLINADSDYVKNVKLSEYTATVKTVEADAPATRTDIFNIVTTFYGDAKTTRGFAWSADTEHTDMVIRYAKASEEWADSYTEKAAVYESYDRQLYYKADISGLEAGVQYVYQVGDTVDDVWSDSYTITTEENNNDEFSFIAITDPQGGSESAYTGLSKTVKSAVADSPDASFILEMGDLVDLGYKEEQWKYYFNSIQKYTAELPHMAVVGNHETRDDGNGTNVAVKHFGLHFNNPKNGADAISGLTVEDVSHVASKGIVENSEETIYSFDYGNAHFVAINTATDAATKESLEIIEAQKEWIKSDLNASNKKWKIVMMHQGMYPAKDARYFGMRDVLEEVFVECGVDLVFQGHDHMVSRTYPMKNGEPVTTQNTDMITEDSGVVYMIPGAAANKRYDNLTDSPSYMAKIINTTSSEPTYSIINVNDSEIEVVTKQINGQVVDSFSIVAEEEIEISYDKTENATTVTADYAEEVSGTPIAAFYIDTKLVKAVTGQNVTGAKSVLVDAEGICEGDFDEVKIFVWDMSLLKPDTAAKKRNIE